MTGFITPGPGRERGKWIPGFLDGQSGLTTSSKSVRESDSKNTVERGAGRHLTLATGLTIYTHR